MLLISYYFAAPVDFSHMISESALYESIETNGVFIGGGQYGKIYVHTVEDGDPTGLPPGSYAFKIQRQGYYQYVKVICFIHFHDKAI